MPLKLNYCSCPSSTFFFSRFLIDCFWLQLFDIWGGSEIIREGLGVGDVCTGCAQEICQAIFTGGTHLKLQICGLHEAWKNYFMIGWTFNIHFAFLFTFYYTFNLPIQKNVLNLGNGLSEPLSTSYLNFYSPNLFTCIPLKHYVRRLEVRKQGKRPFIAHGLPNLKKKNSEPRLKELTKYQHNVP